MKPTKKLQPIKQIKLFFKLTLFSILFVLLMFSTSWAATYYVDATNGNDSYNGLSQEAAWKTVAKVNHSSFNPGDQVLFKRGETWREQLTVPSSGSVGNVITIGAYGSGAEPTINGLDLITNWSDNGGEVVNTWKATVTTEPKIVYFNTTRGTNKASVQLCTGANNWYWSSNVLYVYSTSNPSSAYTFPGIQAGSRSACIVVQGVNYVNFENLSLWGSNSDGISIQNSNYIIFDNVDTYGMYFSGVTTPYTTNASSNITYKNSEMGYNGANGIIFGLRRLDTILIQNNNAHHNCWNTVNDGNAKYTAGIRVWGGYGGSPISNNVIIELNNSHDQYGISNSRGMGIWIDEWGTGAVVRYNKTYDNAGNGIEVEHMEAAKVYYNLSYGNGTVGFGPIGNGIQIFRSAASNEVYNNVCHSNYGAGINVSGYDTYTAMINNLIKNNVSINNTTQLIATLGGENTGGGSGNVYTYNCFGAQARNFIEWGRRTYKSTYSDWETAYGGTTHSVQSEPLFVSTSTPDFHLQPTSPAINAGIDVGLTQDYAGNPIYGTPDIGAYEYQPRQTAPKISG